MLSWCSKSWTSWIIISPLRSCQWLFLVLRWFFWKNLISSLQSIKSLLLTNCYLSWTGLIRSQVRRSSQSSISLCPTPLTNAHKWWNSTCYTLGTYLWTATLLLVRRTSSYAKWWKLRICRSMRKYWRLFVGDWVKV